jgi:hypothetical protein
MGKYDALMAYQTPTQASGGKYDALMAYKPTPMPSQGEMEAAGASQMLPMLHKAASALTPLGSVEEIAGQLNADRPNSPVKAGLAAADLASLGLLSKGGTLAKFAGNLLKNVGIQAAAGATAQGAEMAGLPAPVAVPLGLAAGVAAGRGTMPEMTRQAVKLGEEPSALARALNKSGLTVPMPEGKLPRQITGAFQEAKGAAGAEVGRAKEAALQTQLPAAQVLARIQEAARGGLQSAGVPMVRGQLAPTLATEGAAPAEMVLSKLDALKGIPKNVPGSEAMKLANNVLEGAQKTVADSKRLGTGLAGKTSKEALKAWQGALDALGPAEAVKASKAADSAFSKLATMTEMVEKSSKGMMGTAPGFSPNKFVQMWETMPERMRSRFTPEEVKTLDYMLKQDPGIIQTGITKALQFAKSKGLKGLTFSPSARFYEDAPAILAPRAGVLSGEGLSREQQVENAQRKLSLIREQLGARAR